VTFISPEASRAVWDYLAFRGREPKTETYRRKQQLSKQRIIDDDGYMFILRNVPEEYRKTQDKEIR